MVVSSPQCGEKYNLFLRFSSWRNTGLRHFVGYPCGTSRKKASTIFYDTALLIIPLKLQGKSISHFLWHSQSKKALCGWPGIWGRCNPARRPHLQPMGRPFCLSHLRCQTCPCRVGMGPLFHPYSAAPDQPCRTGGFAPAVVARRSFQVAPRRTGTFLHQAQSSFLLKIGKARPVLHREGLMAAAVSSCESALISKRPLVRGSFIPCASRPVPHHDGPQQAAQGGIYTKTIDNF